MKREHWLSASFQTVQETIAVPPTLIPGQFNFDNFTEVFKTINVLQYLKNSIIVCVCIVFVQYLIIVPAAYSLAKFDYKAKPMLFGLVMLGQMIPMQITFLPIYFMFSRAKLMDSYTALIIPFISNPFGIFLLRQYFMQVPSEVIEAAKLDNASDIKIMFKIMMPMAKSSAVLHLQLEQLLLASHHDEQRRVPYASHRHCPAEGRRLAAALEHHHGRQPAPGSADAGPVHLCQQKNPQRLCIFWNQIIRYCHPMFGSI